MILAISVTGVIILNLHPPARHLSEMVQVHLMIMDIKLVYAGAVTKKNYLEIENILRGL